MGVVVVVRRPLSVVPPLMFDDRVRPGVRVLVLPSSSTDRGRGEEARTPLAARGGELEVCGICFSSNPAPDVMPSSGYLRKQGLSRNEWGWGSECLRVFFIRVTRRPTPGHGYSRRPHQSCSAPSSARKTIYSK